MTDARERLTAVITRVLTVESQAYATVETTLDAGGAPDEVSVHAFEQEVNGTVDAYNQIVLANRPSLVATFVGRELCDSSVFPPKIAQLNTGELADPKELSLVLKHAFETSCVIRRLLAYATAQGNDDVVGACNSRLAPLTAVCGTIALHLARNASA